MSGTSSNPLERSPKPRYSHYRELASFETSISIAISVGMFEESITVRDPDGNYPIVAALSNEKLSYLTARINACGGYANAFVLYDDVVRVIHSTRYSHVPDGSEDFTDLRSGESTIGMFIDYLDHHPDGVCIPARLPEISETLVRMGSQTVATSKIPVLQS